MASDAPHGGDTPNQAPESSEKIPPLTLITPCIFTPINDDMVGRFAEPTRDRVERLERILESIDSQREAVKQNLIYMFSRERQRLILEAMDQEAAQGPGPRRDVDQSELDQVIQSMEAPPQLDRDYRIKIESLPQHQLLPPNPDKPARERVVEGLLNVIEQGTGQLAGYDGHIANIKQHFSGCLEREKQRAEEASLRPEQRAETGLF